MNAISAERLSQLFVDVADTLVDEFDVIEFLQMVTARASDLVQAEAAGLLLADGRGRLQLMAASDERTQMLELFQVQAVEGPCQDAFRLGRPVVNSDLGSASHLWPRFGPRAAAAGYRSVHAFPLRLRGQVIGALNLFGSGSTPLSEEDAQVVQAIADVATIGLLQERSIARAEAITEQLHGALTSRVVVEQAKGALAQIHGESPDQAFDRLRAYCRAQQQKLGRVASLVLTDPAAVAALTVPDG